MHHASIATITKGRRSREGVSLRFLTGIIGNKGAQCRRHGRASDGEIAYRAHVMAVCDLRCPYVKPLGGKNVPERVCLYFERISFQFAGHDSDTRCRIVLLMHGRKPSHLLVAQGDLVTQEGRLQGLEIV